jgi:hypothetical protein
LREALNEAVRSVRLAGANISEAQLKDLSRNVDFDSKSLDEKGDEKDSDGVFVASFIIGLMIYITLAIYGQMILAAVVEEKETRIAEILLSSAKPFELMMGKLTGVGLGGFDTTWDLDNFRSRFSWIRSGADERGGNGHFDSEHFATDGFVVFYLFFARIFYLRFDFCTHRFDGYDDAGRRAIFVSADYAAARRILFQLCRYPRPEFFAVILGFHSAIFRADYDAGQDFGRDASILANRAFYFHQCRDNRRFGMAGFQSLSHRNVDVWQAGDDSRSLEMDSAKLK